MADAHRTILTHLFTAWTILSAAATFATAQVQEQSRQDAAASPIRLNTLGFLPDAPKRATIAGPCEKFAIVRVGDGDGKTLLDGVVTGPVLNDDTDEQLYTADFSALVEPGEYRLDVPGVGRSAPFRIAADLYVEPFRTVTRGMYLLRCGTAVRGEYDGRVYEHAACHLEDGFLDFVGSKGQRRDSTKGWHDAGDYNKYVVNAGVTVGCMFRAWEDFRPQVERIELDIPESAGPLPDFLAELKWELDWLLTMQASDGSVYHKLSARNFCGFVLPEAETARRYFVPWGSAATADFVAMTALAARHFRPYDPEYADRCLAAAKKSYAFLRANPQDHSPDQQGFSTGGYGTQDWDDRLWAAAELWVTTGDADALTDFEARARSAEPARPRGGRRPDDDAAGTREYQWQTAVDWDWGDVRNLGLFAYLLCERPGRDDRLLSQIREGLLATADKIVATRGQHGYARPLGSRYYWGCNGTVARQILVLQAAQRVDAKPEYRDAALDALNYLFGRNTHARSYVTGLGDRPPMHPHDRRSGADEIDEPWPGYLVGGPHPRATDWQDDEGDFRTNEIAINWNGALIYALAAYLDEPAARDASQP
jgi:endoglucanase